MLPNLAGYRGGRADDVIRVELIKAKIEIVEHEEEIPHSEVPTHLTGKLYWVEFRRAWTYWVARGVIPLHIAEEIYADPIGQMDIRASGHCGRIPPTEVAQMFAPDGRRVISTETQAAVVKHGVPCPDSGDDHVVSDTPESIGGRLGVDMYHIDSIEGLRFFADVLRKYDEIGFFEPPDLTEDERLLRAAVGACQEVQP